MDGEGRKRETLEPAGGSVGASERQEEAMGWKESRLTGGSDDSGTCAAKRTDGAKGKQDQTQHRRDEKQQR